MTVARQRFDKHIPKITQSTVVPPFLGSRPLGTFLSNGQNTTNNRKIHELWEVVIYIRFAWKLVHSMRVTSFAIRQSGREDTHSPVRNGASLRQSLIVSCYNWL
jgi:hypothetical protein